MKSMRKARTWNGRSSQAVCNACVTPWQILKEWLCGPLNRGESGQACPANLESPLPGQAPGWISWQEATVGTRLELR